ncbi:MAG: hypoxanthine-guanine phosphoribosyltransferase [Burkholderiales bacterium]
MERDAAWKTLHSAELICSDEKINRAVVRMAGEISAALAEKMPLVLSIMGGAVVFTGQLLPLLKFPLEFDVLHVTRYRKEIEGGEISWKITPGANVNGRVVLVLDDILDEGKTLEEVRARILEAGASAFYSAVLVDKKRPKSMRADFVGLQVPNRYVFGFGMDVRGLWRNLPAIYALRTTEE